MAPMERRDLSKLLAGAGSGFALHPHLAYGLDAKKGRESLGSAGSISWMG